MPSVVSPLPLLLRAAQRSRWMPLLTGLLWSLSLASPAVADDRADARRHFLKGMRLIKEGRYEEGLKQLERANQILPHPAVLFNMGRACFEAGDYPQAITRLEQYLATAPEDNGEAQRLLNLARQRRAELVRESFRASDGTPPATSERPSAASSSVPAPRGETPAMANALFALRQAVEQVERAAGQRLRQPDKAPR